MCSIISFQAVFVQNEGYVPWQKTANTQMHRRFFAKVQSRNFV